MKKAILNLHLLVLTIVAYSQDKPDYTFMKYIVIDTSYYGEIQRIWISQQSISYGTIPAFGNYVEPVGDRKLPLREGEGKAGTLMEANFDLRYPINMGRPSARPLLRRMRLTFDYRGNFRMTKDDSSPIVPWSNDVGISWDFAFYDSHKNWFWQDKDRYDLRTLHSLDLKRFYFASLTTQLHHYSNGQSAGTYYYNTDSSARRNDYIGGNFSTNYLRIRWFNSWINVDSGRLFNLGLGMRFDMGARDGTFNYEQAQEKSYGYKRWELVFDWYSKVIHPSKEEDRHKRLRQWHVRLESDYIVGDLDNFEPNLANSKNKFRLSGHAFIEFRPLSHRSIGYMVHLFAGRDYLNIRYDDIIFLVQGGITLSMDKFYPTGWRAKNTGGLKK